MKIKTIRILLKINQNCYWKVRQNHLKKRVVKTVLTKILAQMKIIIILKISKRIKIKTIRILLKINQNWNWKVRQNHHKRVVKTILTKILTQMKIIIIILKIAKRMKIKTIKIIIILKKMIITT